MLLFLFAFVVEMIYYAWIFSRRMSKSFSRVYYVLLCMLLSVMIIGWNPTIHYCNYLPLLVMISIGLLLRFALHDIGDD